MMGRLRDAARELGRTIVVVLHDINFAAHYADHIVAMKDGRGRVRTGRADHGRRGAGRVFDTGRSSRADGPLAVYY